MGKWRVLKPSILGSVVRREEEQACEDEQEDVH